MDMERAWGHLKKLSPDRQEKVVQFIELLLSVDRDPLPLPFPEMPLRDDPFVGMWRERDDMRDGAKWVRALRRAERTAWTLWTR